MRRAPVGHAQPTSNAVRRDADAGADWPALHSQAIEAGIDPARAWRLTPREIVREADASERRRAADQLVLAWYVARFERAKRLPRLETLLKDLRRPARRRSRQGVSVDQVATINALMGGRDLRGFTTSHENQQ